MRRVAPENNNDSLRVHVFSHPARYIGRDGDDGSRSSNLYTGEHLKMKDNNSSIPNDGRAIRNGALAPKSPLPPSGA